MINSLNAGAIYIYIYTRDIENFNLNIGKFIRIRKLTNNNVLRDWRC